MFNWLNNNVSQKSVGISSGVNNYCKCQRQPANVDFNKIDILPIKSRRETIESVSRTHFKPLSSKIFR